MQTKSQSRRRCKKGMEGHLFHMPIRWMLKWVTSALLVACMLGAPVLSWASSRLPWVEVDTRMLTLTVFSAENQILARFTNISIGSGGTAEIHRRGDETTPLGVYRIAWIDRQSRFGTFYGIDYPSAEIARRAHAEGIISLRERNSILTALQHHRIPPSHTPLGGRLGIHGLGRGDPDIHKTVNWTDGCVALSNPQIRQLTRWMHIGTRVVIR